MPYFPPRIIALSFGLAALVAPAVAHAEAPIGLSVDVTKVIETSYAWFESRARGTPAEKVSNSITGKSATAPDLVGASVQADKPLAAEPKLVLTPPLRLSLVARDWGEAFAVTGGTTVSDEVRLSRSNRMLVGRVRADIGRFSPFAHVGLGEWRYDPTILTLLPANQEYATQLAMGVQIQIAKHARLGIEADYTLLCRESREPQNNPTPHLLGGLAVMHTKF